MNDHNTQELIFYSNSKSKRYLC